MKKANFYPQKIKGFYFSFERVDDRKTILITRASSGEKEPGIAIHMDSDAIYTMISELAQGIAEICPGERNNPVIRAILDVTIDEEKR